MIVIDKWQTITKNKNLSNSIDEVIMDISSKY